MKSVVEPKIPKNVTKTNEVCELYAIASLNSTIAVEIVKKRIIHCSLMSYNQLLTSQCFKLLQ